MPWRKDASANEPWLADETHALLHTAAPIACSTIGEQLLSYSQRWVAPRTRHFLKRKGLDLPDIQKRRIADKDLNLSVDAPESFSWLSTVRDSAISRVCDQEERNDSQKLSSQDLKKRLFWPQSHTPHSVHRRSVY